MHGLEISGVVGWVAIALPLLALLTVAILAVRQVRRRKASPPAPTTGRYGLPVPQPPVAKAPPPPAPPEPPITLVASALAERIGVLEAKGPEAELPRLYLALAQGQIGGEGAAQAAETLRKCIRLAAKLGQKQTHAAARLELGDLLREEGDLTTACEHWQIARGLFFEIKNEKELAAAEKRMRQHGCPTDWVLNDF